MPEAIDPVIERVALWAWAELRKRTPKGKLAGGKTRQAWTLTTPKKGARLLENKSKVMLFLEEGTRAHGPKVKKFLYIPLTLLGLEGSQEGRTKRGRDYILVKRVRGIRAMHIVRELRKEAMAKLKEAMKAHVRALVAG